MTENENIITRWLDAWKDAKNIPEGEIKSEIASHNQAIRNLQMLLPAASSDTITGTIKQILGLLMKNPKIATLVGGFATGGAGLALAPAGTGGGILSNLLGAIGLGG